MNVKRGEYSRIFQKKNFRGQMQIGFGMIFSAFLIIIFIIFAIYVVQKFMEANRFAQVEKFKNDFQEDIDRMWKSTQGSQNVGPYYIPKKIKKVCFIPDTRDELTGTLENLYFEPEGEFNGGYIEHVLISVPFCVNTEGGSVSLNIKKVYNRDTITISRVIQ